MPNDDYRRWKGDRKPIQVIPYGLVGYSFTDGLG